MQKDRKDSILVWLFVTLLIISIPPFFFWNARTMVLCVNTAMCLMFGFWNYPQKSKRRISLLLFFIFYLYVSFHQYGEKNIIGVLWTAFSINILTFLFLIDEENWAKIYKKFVLLYSLTLIPSLVVYFGVRWLNIEMAHTTILPLNELKDYVYQAYPFMVMKDDLDSFRFFGYYDEPGVVGTISGVLFIVNKCNLKEWINWPLLVSGIFSFSLFFYVLISIYIILFGNIKVKISLIIFGLVSFFYFINMDSVFTELILNRLETDDGNWAGDNRLGVYFDNYWNKFLVSDMLWFGYGDTFHKTIDEGGASYKHLIVDYGIVMFLVYIFAFVLYYISYHVRFRELLLLLLILFTVLFQRPFVTLPIYLFLLISPASVISKKR